jgi:hypothetical protein
MRITLVVTRMTDENLRLAAQIGVTDIVDRYPGPTQEALTGLCERVNEHGMRMSALEGVIPHGDVVRGGPKRNWQIENYQQLFENMAAGIVERRGSRLIHGAIIAREYGLPCVTGVPDATELIRTGGHLTVDGYLRIVVNSRAAASKPATTDAS